MSECDYNTKLHHFIFYSESHQPGLLSAQTVGYGDIAIKFASTKAFLIFYVLIAPLVLAFTFDNIITLRSRIARKRQVEAVLLDQIRLDEIMANFPAHQATLEQAVKVRLKRLSSSTGTGTSKYKTATVRRTISFTSMDFIAFDLEAMLAQIAVEDSEKKRVRAEQQDKQGKQESEERAENGKQEIILAAPTVASEAQDKQLLQEERKQQSLKLNKWLTMPSTFQSVQQRESTAAAAAGQVNKGIINGDVIDEDVDVDTDTMMDLEAQVQRGRGRGRGGEGTREKRKTASATATVGDELNAAEVKQQLEGEIEGEIEGELTTQAVDEQCDQVGGLFDSALIGCRGDSSTTASVTDISASTTPSPPGKRLSGTAKYSPSSQPQITSSSSAVEHKEASTGIAAAVGAGSELATILEEGKEGKEGKEGEGDFASEASPLFGMPDGAEVTKHEFILSILLHLQKIKYERDVYIWAKVSLFTVQYEMSDSTTYMCSFVSALFVFTPSSICM